LDRLRRISLAASGRRTFGRSIGGICRGIADLAEVGRVASERFRQLHPEISEAGVEAIAWRYTYDFK
jgi:hypothetical protein